MHLGFFSGKIFLNLKVKPKDSVFSRRGKVGGSKKMLSHEIEPITALFGKRFFSNRRL